jgi:hypothetical protein
MTPLALQRENLAYGGRGGVSTVTRPLRYKTPAPRVLIH